MKSLEEFVNSMVKVEYIEQSGCFGHYPFQLFAEMKDGSYEISALALGCDVETCYNFFAEAKHDGAKRIYLSLDFPKGGDIENDFIAIFSFENNEINLQAKTYSLADGKIISEITESEHLKNILDQFTHFLYAT